MGRFICLLFVSLSVSAQFQEIDFKHLDRYIPMELDETRAGSRLNPTSQAILEVFKAKPVKGNAKLNGKWLRGWELNTGDFVYEVVQMLQIINGNYARVLTCLTQDDGTLMQSTLWKTDPLIERGHELWSYTVAGSETPKNQGVKILEDIHGPSYIFPRQYHNYRGSREEILARVNQLFDYFDRHGRIKNEYSIRLGYTYKGSYTKAGRFKTRLNALFGEILEEEE